VIVWTLATAAEVPAGDAWLSATEAAQISAARRPKRSAELRLGRFAAKRALQGWLGGAPALARLEVRAAEDGAPEAWLDGTALPCALSLSHRDGVALCALGAGGTPLGCDLERVEPRAPSFAREWLGTAEGAALRALPAGDRDRRLTVFWSAKESALKALRCGLRRDPRDVLVAPGREGSAGEWHPLTVHCTADPAAGFPEPLRLAGGWRCLGAYVLSVVVAEAHPRSPRWIARSPLSRPGR
jgi:4'-phosphopantetheinyl transferase